MYEEHIKVVNTLISFVSLLNIFFTSKNVSLELNQLRWYFFAILKCYGVFSLNLFLLKLLIIICRWYIFQKFIHLREIESSKSNRVDLMIFDQLLVPPFNIDKWFYFFFCAEFIVLEIKIIHKTRITVIYSCKISVSNRMSRGK